MDTKKIEELKSILKELKIECARKIEEKVDLQYASLENLHRNLENDEIFIKLVIINALVSYQLSTTGESWWNEFSEYWSNEVRNTADKSTDIFENYKDFIVNSKGNKRLLGAKLKRIEKIKPFLEKLTLEDLRKYYENMSSFRDDLVSTLKTKKDAKTVVFAVKMFGYASRIVFNEFIPYPMEIEIPKDSRIEKYTKRYTEEDPIKFWNRIALETNIPPLHIDSIIWPVLGKSKEVRERLKEYFENETFIQKLKLIFKLSDM
ncbi:MAG: DNA-(apurinic or apyrimidinic site) lyase [Methanothermococcus sp.]|uniref:N-glycosylase/DNA lyase n=1 Tax=Methanothermococcus TaxID=155862 RepID=UPI00036105D4|nr:MULTISPECIES: N-glycosylase/DNA lyase [Methanothermococcus]MDK2790054.1 DNA-(apurinic or apyrimidinic site) lyase [Methanothermococcus sp.]MDK2987105.1 DNA-(apurinic or apyrimidinic site) lyase [Methanothermococcus sp.]